VGGGNSEKEENCSILSFIRKGVLKDAKGRGYPLSGKTVSLYAEKLADKKIALHRFMIVFHNALQKGTGSNFRKVCVMLKQSRTKKRKRPSVQEKKFKMEKKALFSLKNEGGRDGKVRLFELETYEKRNE